jgi:hypothetical protein
MIESLIDRPNHVQTLPRSEAALAVPAFFLQVLRELALREVLRELALREVLRELALREVFRELALRVHSELSTIAHQRSVLQQVRYVSTSMPGPSRLRLFLKEHA